MKFTSLYKHDRERSASFATVNNEESVTQQDDATEADINVIVGRFIKTGQLPNVTMQPLSGDFVTAPDFRDIQERLRIANEAFAEVPAEIRKRFGNDPAEFIDFASKKENLPELRKLGLAMPEKAPPKEPDPIKVIVTNPEPPK